MGKLFINVIITCFTASHSASLFTVKNIIPVVGNGIYLKNMIAYFGIASLCQKKVHVLYPLYTTEG